MPVFREGEMAKLLPFVNSNTPFHTIFEKVNSKFTVLPAVDKIQLLNIIVNSGIKNVEDVVSQFPQPGASENQIVRHVIRNFTTPPIAFHDLAVMQHFCDLLVICDLSKKVFSEELLYIESSSLRAEFLMLLRNSPEFSNYCSLPPSNLFSQAYKNSSNFSWLFSSSGQEVYFNKESLKAYVLFFYVAEIPPPEPVKAVMYTGEKDAYVFSEAVHKVVFKDTAGFDFADNFRQEAKDASGADAYWKEAKEELEKYMKPPSKEELKTMVEQVPAPESTDGEDE